MAKFWQERPTLDEDGKRIFNALNEEGDKDPTGELECSNIRRDFGYCRCIKAMKVERPFVK